MIPRSPHRAIALALATLFFVFQTELDHEEYLQHHRQLSAVPAFAAPSLTWETFDKENAPKAFIVTVDRGIACLLLPHVESRILLPPSVSVHPVRDKSPPSPAHEISCS